MFLKDSGVVFKGPRGGFLMTTGKFLKDPWFLRTPVGF